MCYNNIHKSYYLVLYLPYYITIYCHVSYIYIVYHRECTAITSYGKCFTVVDNTPTFYKNWNQSKSECFNHDQRLASVLSKREEEITKKIVSPNTGLWIGLNDIENEGVYVWVDGSTYDFINWAVPYPTGGRDLNCVLIYNGESSDQNCNDTRQNHLCSSTGEYFDILLISLAPCGSVPENCCEWEDQS